MRYHYVRPIDSKRNPIALFAVPSAPLFTIANEVNMDIKPTDPASPVGRPVEQIEPDLTPAPGTPRDDSQDHWPAGSDEPAGGEDPDLKRPTQH